MEKSQSLGKGHLGTELCEATAEKARGWFQRTA
jgi:hypothetical protein